MVETLNIESQGFIAVANKLTTCDLAEYPLILVFKKNKRSKYTGK
jgi:hypothetical protein